MIRTRPALRRIAIAVMTVPLLLTGVVFYQAPANAEGSTYPWSDADHVPQPPASDDITWGYTNKTTCDDKSDDYNCATYKEGAYYVYDQWNYYLRNCTSYAAWKAATVHGKNISGWGSAITWDSGATAAGYTVDTTPEVGDIAQSNDGVFGHVGYVESVQHDQSGATSSITVSEFNRLYDGNHSSNTYSHKDNNGLFKRDPNNQNTASRWHNFIDLNGSAAAMAGTPSAVARGTGAMNVFYRTTDNKLIAKGWDASTGWNHQQLADNAVGNPIAIMRGDKMEVFYRNTNQGLSNVGWDAAGGWHGPSVVGGMANGIASDPAAISLNADNMEVFVRTINNELKSYSWHPSVGWYGLNTRISSGVDSSPSAVVRDANNVDIFYRRSNANLGKLSWNLSGPWTTYEWAADMEAGAAPAVLSRTSGNLDVFYRKNNGWLMDRHWDWTVGWGLSEWSGLLTGNPAVVARNTGDMDVVYREDGSPGSIKNARWNWQTGWASGFIATDAVGDPAIIKRSASNMDVFYRASGDKLKVTTWSSMTGWSQPGEPQ